MIDVNSSSVLSRCARIIPLKSAAVINLTPTLHSLRKGDTTEKKPSCFSVDSTCPRTRTVR